MLKRFFAVLYFAAVLLPGLLLLMTGQMEGILPYHAAARFFAVTAFAMLLMQPVLSARFHWLEKPFGLDRVLAFHRLTGITAAAFAILHPLFLALGSKSFALLTDLNSPWQITAGRLTILILLFYGGAALYHKAMKIPFQLWLRMHNAGAPFIIAGAFLHSWFMAVRYFPLPLKVLWFVLPAVSLFSYLHLTLYQRLRARSCAMTVSQVNPVTSNVWELVLTPGKGGDVFSYLPGQFLFLTLLRGRDLPVEEHPFTISSSPSERDHISVAVKESGDFTSSMGQTRPKDRASVLAPYGRFSFMLHPERKRTAFIAGGIGITPVISMLRYMTHSKMEREVFLFYANRTEPDIAFRDELETMGKEGSVPKLKLVHILSKPGESWTGEKGRLSGEILGKHLGDFGDTAFYICGPPPMMDSAAAVLLSGGADPRDVHMEKFAL